MNLLQKIKFNLWAAVIAALLFCPSFLSAAETVIESDQAKLIMNFNEGLNIADGDSLKLVYTGTAANPSALLRDVSGNPSYWGGSFWSNYSVILVNPNGITIGANANIQAASFIASTLDITDDNFLHPEKYNNAYIFSKWVDKVGKSVINNGYIKVREGGQAVLLGSAAANSGTIEATLGSVALAAGEAITLGMDSAGMISVVIDQAVQEEIFTADGKKLTSAVENSGTILADGGKVVLSAKVLNKVFDYAINNSGVIQANSLVNHQGVIELVGEGDVAIKTVVNTGSIIANGTLAAPDAGKITLNGLTILQQGKITANALENGTAGEVEIVSVNSTVVDSASSTEARASGLAGNGGRVRIDSTGGNTLVNKNALIDVSAGSKSGSAGSIDVGAFDQLGFYGILNGRAPPGYNPATVTFTYHSSLVPSVTITTDQEDYAPSGKPIISGSGFLPNQEITLNIVDPNGMQTTLNVVADATGAFTYIYTPDSLMGGVYFVTGTDGSRSAIAKFTDAILTTTAAGGNWNATTTWSGGVVPLSTDDVTIVAGATVTVTADATIKSITFNNASVSTGTLTVNTGVVLTVTTGILLQNSASTNTSANITGAGTINCASITVGGSTIPTSDKTTTLTSTITALTISGDLSIYGQDAGASENNSAFNLSSGSVNVGGSVVLDADDSGTGSGASATLTLATGSQNGTFTLSGVTPFTISGIGSLQTFTANGTSATVIYSRSGNQTVRAVTYTNLTLSGSGVKTTSGATVNGILSMEGTATTTGTAPTYGGSATLQYKGSAAQTTGIEFPAAMSADVIIDNASGVTINAAKTLNANLTLIVGTLSAGTNLTMGSTGTPLITRSGGDMTGTLQGGNDYNVTYTGNSKTTGAELSGSGFADLTVNLTAGQTLTLDQNRAPDDDVTITSGIFDPNGFLVTGNGSGNTLSVTDTIIIDTTTFAGDYTGFETRALNAGSTVEYQNANPTLDAGLTYQNLIFSGTGTASASNNLTIQGNLTNTNGGTLNFGTRNVTFSGTTTQSIAGFTTTGTVSMTKTNGTATFTGNVNGNGLTINGTGGTLNLGMGLTHTFTGTWTRTAGTLNGGSATLNLGGSVGGTGGTFTASTGTVEYNAAGAQTGAVTIYNNLTLSNSGVKTFATTPTVNGVLSIEGTATVSVTTGVITYGTNATLQYNTSTARTASSEEWLATFAATGGVIIANTGTITLNAAKVFNASAPLTINSGATLNIQGNNLTVSGTFSNDGTFKLNGTETLILTMDTDSGTVEYAGDNSGGTITVQDFGATDYFNLIFRDYNSSRVTFSLNWALDVAGTFTIGQGTFNANVQTVTVAGLTSINGESYNASSATQTFNGGLKIAGGNFIGSTGAVDVNGDFYFSGSSFTAPSGDFTVSGNWNVVTAGGDFSLGTGTVTFDGTSSGNTIQTSTRKFYNLTINGALGEWVLSDALGVTNNFTLTNGTLDVSSSNFDITIGGNWTNNGGTFIAADNTVTFDGAGTQNITSGGSSFYGLVIANTSDDTVYLQDALDVDGDLTIENNSTLDAGENTITIAGNWVNNGTFTHNSGTVTFNGGGEQTIDSGSSPFYNLVNSNASPDTLLLNDTLNVEGNLTIDSGSVLDTQGNDINIAGNWVNSGTFNADGGTVNFNGTETQDITSGGSNFYNLIIANTSSETVYLQDSLVIDADLTIQNGSVLDSNRYDITISGNWDNQGEFNHGDNTVTFNSTGTQYITSGGSSFYNLDIANTSADTVYLEDELNLDGNLTIEDTSILNSGGYDVTLAGDWNNYGTFIHNNNTVTFNGDDIEQAITSGNSSFYNLIIGESSEEGDSYSYIYLNDVLNVQGNLTIKPESTLDAQDENSDPTDIFVTGDWDNQGEFYHNENTVTFNGIGDQTISGENTFNNVTVDNRDSGTVSFTGSTTIDEGLTVNGPGAYSVSFTGSNNTFSNAVTFSNTGGLTLGDEDTDNTSFDGGVDTGTNAVNMAGTISTDNATMAFQAVTLTAQTTLDSNEGNIQITSLTGGQDLILAAGIGAGITTFTGNVTNLGDGSGAALAIQDGVTGLVWFQGTLDAKSGITAEGENSNIQFDDDVTLGASDTVSTFNGNVTLDGLTFTSNAGDEVTFGGSTNNQLTLSADPVSIVTAGAFTVNSKIDGAQDLTLDTAGEATFEGDIGSVTAIGDGIGAALTVNSSGVTNFKAKLTTASGVTQNNDAGRIIFRERVTIGAGDTPTTFNANVRLSGIIFTVNNTATFGDSAADRLDLAVNGVTIKALGGADMIFNSKIQGNQDLTINSGSGTATFNGEVDISSIFTKQGTGNVSFGNSSFSADGLTLSKGAINNAATDNGTWTINGDVEISGGATLKATSGDFYVTGNWVNNGTFTHNSGTVTFNGGGEQTIDSGSSPFYNLVNSNASPDTLLLNDTLNVEGNLTIDSGSVLDTQGNNINIYGNWINNGTFDASGNTVTFRGITQSDITGSNTFYNLTIDTTADGAKTVRFGAGDTQTITNALILTGAEGKTLTIRSTSEEGVQATLDIPASIDSGVNYVNVQDNKIAGDKTITPNQDNSEDSGNNTNWIFNQNPNLPDNLGPANLVDGNWANDNTPTFNFDLSDSDEGQQVKFQIQLDNDSDFSSPLIDYTSALGAQGGFTFTVGQAAGDGAYTTGNQGQTLADSLSGYYWKVKAIDSESAASGWQEAGVAGTVDFKVDTVAPVVTATPDIGPNANGWNKDNVTVSFSATDIGGSGVVNTDPSILISAEGTSSVNGTATDAAGNVGTSATVTVKLDKTAPEINVTSPTDGGIYTTQQTLTYTVTDNLDVLPDITGLPSGTIFTGVGTHTVIIDATDLAGNSAQANLSFVINPQPEQQSQISSASFILSLTPSAGQLGQHQFNTFNPPGGPVYFYHPLTPMDISAFDALILGNDAYQFIGGSINILGHDGLLPRLFR